jgi:hypothetical protein
MMLLFWLCVVMSIVTLIMIKLHQSWCELKEIKRVTGPRVQVTTTAEQWQLERQHLDQQDFSPDDDRSCMFLRRHAE